MLKLSKLKNKKGFTLIEAVVSILILGTAMGLMLVVFVMSRVSIAMAKHRIEAINHARAAMEQYINSGDTTYNVSTGDIAALDGSCAIPTPTSYATGIEKVVVTVSWTEHSMGSNKSVSEELVTLVIE